MKSSPSLATLFKPEQSEQPIRLIKAAQAGKILGNGHSHVAPAAGVEAQKKPEIRLIKTGPDFCDIEVICGCGESTTVRCWNSPGAAA